MKPSKGRTGSLVLLWLLLGVGSAAAQPRNADVVAADGTQLRVTFHPAATSGPGVMRFHMCGSASRGSWDRLARDLVQKGIHVLTFDYRGYGESGGEPVASLPDDRQRAARRMWPDDFDRVFAHLLAQPGVERTRIGAAGASCGVDNAVQLARRHQEVKSLVLLSGRPAEDGRQFLSRNSWLPVFTSASDDDFGLVETMQWVVGFSHNPQSTFVGFEHAGHGTEMFAAESSLAPMVAEWFDTTLRQTASVTAKSTTDAPPSPAAVFWALLTQPGGVARAATLYHETRQRQPGVVSFPEVALRAYGNERLLAGEVKEAIAIFELNAAAYPDSPIVYNGLALAFMADGNRARAIENTEHMLRLLDAAPGFPGRVREALRRQAMARLENLRREERRAGIGRSVNRRSPGQPPTPVPGIPKTR